MFQIHCYRSLESDMFLCKVIWMRTKIIKYFDRKLGEQIKEFLEKVD